MNDFAFFAFTHGTAFVLGVAVALLLFDRRGSARWTSKEIQEREG